MMLDEDVLVKSFECSILNSRKINIKANLEVNAKVYSSEDVKMISNVEETGHIQVLKKQVKINSLVGHGISRTQAKETIGVETSEGLAEIMRS